MSDEVSYSNLRQRIIENDTQQVSEMYQKLKETFYQLSEGHNNFLNARELEHVEDQLSDALLPSDIPVDLQAQKTSGDGNCLFHAASLSMTGKENLSQVLRLATACELYLNSEFYADHPRITEASTNPSISTSHIDTLFTYILSDEGDEIFCRTRDKIETIKLESNLTCIPGRWCSLLHTLALSSVIEKNTYMIYPDCNYGIRPLLNGEIKPRCINDIDQTHLDTIYILWSRDSNLDNTPRAAYQPNHFVCLNIVNSNVVLKETQKRRTTSDDVHQNMSSCKKTKQLNSDQPTQEGRPDYQHTPLSVSCSNFDSFLSRTNPVDNETKYALIKNRIPPENYSFPSTEYKDKSKKSGIRKRSCQHQWFQQFNFITYSMKNDGIYCLPCILFPMQNTPGGRAKNLIELPYKKWKDVVTDLKSHSVSGYHKISFEQMTKFVEVMEKEDSGIEYILDKQLRERVEKNRKVLESIIRCIEFCGRHGIALRGHRESENPDVDESIDKDLKIEKTGNFKGLLKLCSDLGDKTLTEHLETCAKSATYTSKTSQNELLVCIKKYIQSEIIDKIQSQPHGPLFGIQADECTDVSGQEQLGIVLRYLVNGVTPVEKIIEFVECQETTGAAIAENIIGKINDLGLNMRNCRSQSYDNAANMTGVHKGCATKIKELFPQAKFYYCMNHDLNLAVSKSCQLSEMMIMLENTKQLGIFFKYSPKRQNCLEESFGEVNKERNENQEEPLKKYKLKTLCETRWVERHTTLEHLYHIYEAVIHCLTTIATRRKGTWDAKSVTEANGLLTQISSVSWIIALCTNLHFSGYLRNLSQLLQGPTKDILTAFKKITVVKEELKDIRQRSEEEFNNNVWPKATALARVTGTELLVPRRCGRQSLRNNTPANSPMEYWLRCLFIPYTDHLIMEFENRFSHANETSTLALCLLPSNLGILTEDKITQVQNFFEDDLPSPAALQGELRLWKREWAEESHESVPESIEDTLKVINDKFYPNITMIFRLLQMLPVSAATVERSHSAFKAIKTKLRSTTTEDRVNALILLYVHKDIMLDYSKIIDIYARAHPRRMKLLNPLM